MTPQDHLHYISLRIRELTDFFKGDEETDDIIDRITNIEKFMSKIEKSQDRQENIMNLIIKLLTKDESSNRQS